MAAQVVTLIDASGFIFRAYHAIQHLSTSKGVPTNAAYGFTRMLLKTLREMNPTHVALAFDKESRAGRQAIDPEYKANREGPPPDLIPQFELIRRVVEALNVPVLEQTGWEADDVIGTLAARARSEGFEVLVVTGDKDFVQIVDDHVRLFDPMLDRHTGPKDVTERLGIRPPQMRDYLALVGDAIDNVPKVPGVGPKTAVELLAKFGDVETLLARAAEIDKPKVREAVVSHADQVRRAKQLVSFKTDLPLEVSLESLARRPIHDAQARALFSELEFFKLLQEMPAQAVTPLQSETKLVLQPAELTELARGIREAGQVSLVPVYEGPARAPEWIGLALALPQGKTFYVPLRHRYVGMPEQPSVSAVREVLGDALADEKVAKVGHNLKALWLVLKAHGMALAGLDGDIELLSYLLNASRKEHALADLARERLHVELPPMPEGGGKKRTAWSDLTVEEAAGIWGARADAALRLCGPLWEDIRREGLEKLTREVELPLVPVLGDMERAGVHLDQGAFGRISGRVDLECAEKVKAIHQLVGHAFNVNSNGQLAQVLYEELKLPVLKKGKTGPSTDQDVLEKLAEQHPLPRALIDYRALSKLKSTYLDTLPGLVAADGRIHTTFHQTGAATGRLSSTDPNLQNIPIRSELGLELRRAFVSEPGRTLISADYSQIELRLLAHVAEDAVLIDAFRRDEDIHTRTAAEVFGVKPEDVSPNQRRAAKAVNFGIAYGLSAHGLATRLDIPNEEAKSVIDRYFARYAGIRRWLDQTIELARKRGYVETLFGRRRYVPEIQSRNHNASQAAERAAINMPIQGTAADLIKIAMIRVAARLNRARAEARMLLQVHDELLFEAPAGEVEATVALAREEMSSVYALKVPLKVDVGAAANWADAH